MGQKDDLPIKYAKITAASAADNEIVAAVAGKAIIVWNYTLISTSANTLTWKSATTAITGAMAVAANGGISTPDSNRGLFITTAGEALNLAFSGATQVSGHITYSEL